MEIREIPEKKEMVDGDSWMYDDNINNAIIGFSRVKKDDK